MARLPDYLRALTDLRRQHIDTVSSGDLADAAGVTAAQLRRDLSYLGSYGVRGVGYDTAHLVTQIGARLGVGRSWPVVVVGAGRLGQALAGHPGLTDGRFGIVALLDSDPRVVGVRAGRFTIADVDSLDAVVAEHGPVIGVIATSVDGAQEACDTLYGAGVRVVLSFVPGHLRVPADLRLRRVDVASELAVLAFHAGLDAAAQAPIPSGALDLDHAGALDLDHAAALDHAVALDHAAALAVDPGHGADPVDTPSALPGLVPVVDHLHDDHLHDDHVEQAEDVGARESIDAVGEPAPGRLAQDGAADLEALQAALDEAVPAALGGQDIAPLGFLPDDLPGELDLPGALGTVRAPEPRGGPPTAASDIAASDIAGPDIGSSDEESRDVGPELESIANGRQGAR